MPRFEWHDPTMSWIVRGSLTAMAVLLPATLPAQRPTIRDSAGIQVVTNTAPAWNAVQRPILDSVPRLVIGNRGDDPYQLTRVAGTARLADGRIVVADGGSLQLRFYDAGGTFLTAAAGRGGGPGELRRLQSLFRLHGDTLAVVAGLGLVVYYDGSGTYVRTVNLRAAPPAGLPVTFPAVLAAFADGSTIVGLVSNPPRRSPGDRWLQTVPVALVDATGRTVRPLGDLPFSIMVMDEQPRPPWFAAPLSPASSDEVFYLGLGTEYSIRGYTRDGRLTRLIRRRWTPAPVRHADIEAFVVEWGKRWIRETGAEAERQLADLRDDPYEKTVPAFSQLLADRSGRLWVRTPNLADAPRAGQLNSAPLAPSTWSIFDPDGVWLGDVTRPADFQPFDVGADYVLGVARDADDVETVVEYGLSTH